MKLDPSFGHQARAVAVAINHAANELKAKRVSRRSGQRGRNRCAGLHRRRRHGRAALEAAQPGALSDVEFAQAKARVLAA